MCRLTKRKDYIWLIRGAIILQLFVAFYYSKIYLSQNFVLGPVILGSFLC